MSEEFRSRRNKVVYLYTMSAECCGVREVETQRTLSLLYIVKPESDNES
jgi:hypothetical protein